MKTYMKRLFEPAQREHFDVLNPKNKKNYSCLWENHPVKKFENRGYEFRWGQIALTTRAKK